MIVAAAGYTASFPVAAAPSGDPASDATTVTTLAPDAEEGIIPAPDSGHEPTEAGDRGGALQLAVLGGIVIGVTGVVTLAVRESRRSLAARRRA